MVLDFHEPSSHEGQGLGFDGTNMMHSGGVTPKVSIFTPCWMNVLRLADVKAGCCTTVVMFRDTQPEQQLMVTTVYLNGAEDLNSDITRLDNIRKEYPNIPWVVLGDVDSQSSGGRMTNQRSK